jgi:CHAD domain-containing protein
VLPAAVWTHYGNLRAYETVLDWASLETIHALRIEGKRLRYLLEFFGEVLGPGPAPAIEALVALQDHIGELHDAEVAVDLLREFLIRGAQASIEPAVANAARSYLKVEQARLRTLERTLKRPWRRVSSPRFRLLLARAVAAL